MIMVVVLAVIELKQVLKIVEDLADYIALGVTGEIEKRQWSGYWHLKTEDYYMHRGTSSNDLNSIQDTSESGETITWTNVGEEADIFFGFLISIFLISVHILYVVDVA